MTEFIHASAVSLAGQGVLIIGPSGSGKSSLALQLIEKGSILISDDQVGLTEISSGVRLTAHPNGNGQIEARSIGILRGPYEQSAPCALVTDLGKSPSERLPQPLTWTFAKASVPALAGQNVANLATVVCLTLLGGYRVEETGR